MQQISTAKQNKKNLTFSELLERQKTWDNYIDFCSQVPGIIANEIRKNAEKEERLIKDIKKHPLFKKLEVRNVASHLGDAKKLLNQGDVVGIDGTIAKYRLLSGIRCQIGVVAVNYIGDQIKHSFFISQSNIREEATDALERILQRTEIDDSLSDMHLRGIMLYREREAGLNSKFESKYLLYHGPLLPFELMSGLGRLRALDTTLHILRKLILSKRCMSIISTTSFKEYTYLGLAIKNGQYLFGKNYTLGRHLLQTSKFLTWTNKWREEERKKVEDFITNYAEKISIGVIKIGDRPYVFHAHEDIFDLAAAIIAEDSMFQREKGFPLLIDYADALCSQYFSQSEFNRMVEWELARCENYLRESGERRMRVK